MPPDPAGKKESSSLNSLIRGETTEALPSTFLSGCTIDNDISAEILNACYISVNKDITKGMTFLSIVASTAPFIGLFGTVVSILESFTQFSGSSKVSFSVIAPVISEALVATAAGIFVAIFAYTFHQILNRKAYELSTIIKSASDIILSRNK
jgi:biopolymer transport protein ExbB/TolQ